MEHKRKIPTVLYVDDESNNLQGFKAAFRKEYNILLAESGQKALDILAKENVDVLVADNRMPKMTGAELLKHAYDLYPRIIRFMITGYSDVEAVIEAINLGHISAYFSKPIDPEKFIRQTHQALEGYYLKIENEKLLKQVKNANDSLIQQSENLQLEIIRRQEIEKQSQLNYQEFRNLLEAVPDAIIIADYDGKIHKVNSSAEKLIQKDRSELIGSRIEQYFVAESLEQENRNVLPPEEELIDNQLIEVDMLQNNGLLLHLQVNLSPHSIGDKKLFVASIRDISAQKRAQKAVQESEENYRNLLQSSPQRIFYKDTHGNYVKVNESLARDFNMTPDELIGKNDLDIYPPDEAEKFQETDKQVLQKKKTLDVLEKQELNGDVRYFQTIKSPIYDFDKNVIGILGISTDVTQKKQIEEELERERFLFQSFMNYLPDNIYFKNQESKFIRANKAMAKYFGLTSEKEVVGKSDFDFFSDEHAQDAFDDEQKIMKTKKPHLYEERETWPDKEDTWVSTIKMPLLDSSGNVLGTFGLSRDITEIKNNSLRLKDSNEELALLNEINSVAGQEDAVDLVMDLIFKYLAHSIHADHMIFFNYDENNRCLVNQKNVIDLELFEKLDKFLGFSSLEMAPDIDGTGIYAQCIRDKKSFIVSDTADMVSALLEWFPKRRKNKKIAKHIISRGNELVDIKCTGAIPLASQKSTLGMITFNTKEPVEPKVLQKLDRIGSQVATILQKVQYANKLADFQQKIQLALEASFTGFWTWDVKGGKMYWDERTRKILGVSADVEPNVDLLKKIAHPEDIVDALGKLEKVFEGEVVTDLGLRIIHPDKSIHYVLFRGRALKDENNDVYFINSICIDVTDRMLAEEAAIRSTNRLAALIKALPDLVFLINEEGQYLEVLAADNEILYTPVDQIIGKTIYDIMPSNESIAELEHFIDQALKSGKLQNYEIQRDVNAGNRWFECRIAPLQGKIDGKQAVVYILRDITDRKISEQKFAELNEELEQRVNDRTEELEKANKQIGDNEARLNLAFKGSEISWWDWDVKGNRMIALRDLFALLGYNQTSGGEKIEWLEAIIHPEDRVVIGHFKNDILNKKDRDISAEIRLRKKDGEYIWFYIRGDVVKVDDHNTPVRVVGILQNISIRKIAENQRDIQNHYLNTLLNTMPAPIYSLDKLGNFSSCNKAFKSLFQIDADKLYGKSIMDSSIPEHDILYSPNIDHLLQHAGSDQVEKDIVYKGEERNLVFHRATIVDNKNKPDGLITVITDITDIKKAEKEIKQSEERYKSLFDASPDGILIADSKTLKFQYANEAACTLFGYSLQEFYNLTIPECHPARYRDDKFLQGMKKTIENKMIASLTLPIIRKDGTEIPTDFRISHLKLQNQNFLMGIFRDITDRLKAENALVESEKRFRELTDLLPQAVFELDRNGRFIYVNKYGLESTGYTEEDIQSEKGVHYDDIISAESMAAYRIYLSTILRGKRTRPHEYFLRRKDGSTFPCIIYASPILHEGKILGTRGITIDITERKKIEKELKEHASELELFNKSMLGREKRVIELKDEVNALALQLGMKLPYPPIWN